MGTSPLGCAGEDSPDAVRRERYAVYVPPTASVHYDAALEHMGLGGEAPDVPTVVPTPRPDEEAAPEPEGPEAASRQGGGGGIRTHKPQLGRFNPVLPPLRVGDQ